MNWRSVHRAIDDATFAIGTLLNVVLLAFILTTRVKEMVAYKRILIQSCVVDLMLAVSTFVVKPMVVIDVSSEFVLVNGYFRKLPPAIAIHLFLSWCFCLFMTIMSLPVSFIYRYRVLCCNQDFSLRTQLVALALSALATIGFCGILYWAYFVTGEKYLHLPEATRDLLADDDGFVRACGIFLAGSVQQYVLLLLGALTFLVYGVIIWCSVKMYTYLNKRDFRLANKRAAVDIQRQLNRMMMTQATIPFVSVVLPMLSLMVILLSGTFGCSAVLSIIVTIFFSWIPIGNSLSVIIFVKSFKNKFLKLCRCKNPMTSTDTDTSML